MISDYFKISINNLRRRKLRSWLTMIGIFVGIAAVVALTSLGQGLQNAITSQFDVLSTDVLTVQNAETGFGPPGSTAIKKLNEHDVKIIKSVRGVKEVIPRLIRVAKIDYNEITGFSYMGDIPEEKEQMQILYDSANLEAEKGRLLKPGDRGKILIGSNLETKNQFNKDIGIGKKIKIRGNDFEVIGILKKTSAFSINDVILMLNKDMKSTLVIGDEIDLITLKIEKNENIEEVAERIRKTLRKDRGLKEGEDDFSVQTPLQSISTVNQILSVINMIVIGIALISILVGGIGVANTMYTSVLERRKEIGTMKAIGAKNSDILWIFLTESGLLGLIGGILGVLIGAGLAIGLSEAANIYFQNEIISVKISFILTISVLMFSFLLGVFFGALPSYQASKLKPVDALKG